MIEKSEVLIKSNQKEVIPDTFVTNIQDETLKLYLIENKKQEQLEILSNCVGIEIYKNIQQDIDRIEFDENGFIIRLNLSNYNNITSISKELCKLEYLKEIFLYNCKNLKTLSKEIFKLEHLEELDLTGTLISSIPFKEGYFKKLNCLIINGCNNLNKLPIELKDLVDNYILEIISLKDIIWSN